MICHHIWVASRRAPPRPDYKKGYWPEAGREIVRLRGLFQVKEYGGWGCGVRTRACLAHLSPTGGETWPSLTFEPTWAQLGPNLGPTWTTWLQLGPNLGPTWHIGTCGRKQAQHEATSASGGELHLKLGLTCHERGKADVFSMSGWVGTVALQKSSKQCFFCRDLKKGKIWDRLGFKTNLNYWKSSCALRSFLLPHSSDNPGKEPLERLILGNRLKSQGCIYLYSAGLDCQALFVEKMYV